MQYEKMIIEALFDKKVCFYGKFELFFWVWEVNLKPQKYTLAVHRWRWCLVALDFARLQQRPLKLASGLFSRFWVYLDTKWTTEIAVKRPFQAKLRSSYSFIFHLQNVEIKFGLLAVTKVAWFSCLILNQKSKQKCLKSK